MEESLFEDEKEIEWLFVRTMALILYLNMVARTGGLIGKVYGGRTALGAYKVVFRAYGSCFIPPLARSACQVYI